jgi:hypothetical protein
LRSGEEKEGGRVDISGSLGVREVG